VTRLFADHPRHFAANRFVYPVVSRRSGGISIGINLNPDKVCNFDCIYCQVNRVDQSETRFVGQRELLSELDEMLRLVTSGELFADEKFAATPTHLRRLNDMAFSGDGEPTTYRNFDEIIEACARVKKEHGLDHVKMVLITNASMFHRPAVQRGLAILDANWGEIWAKLEAGTEEYYRLVERTSIPFQRILENIAAAAKVRPLVIQALFMRIHGELPSPAEQTAFCDRLNEIVATGGKLKLVQIYTVARPPAEGFVTPLSDAEVDALASLVRDRTGLLTTAFYAGGAAPPGTDPG
jgi:wyosine [tRNA(Phe)-imidazoG37] synthetase (radical SAM superfamily)